LQVDLKDSESSGALHYQLVDVVTDDAAHRQELGSPYYFPTEIWCLIFEIGEQSRGSTVLPSKTSHRIREGSECPFPLLVSHVCQHWRDISINTPSLWTWIDYDTYSWDGYELANSDVVGLFIERAQGQPLDIRLTSYSYGIDLTLIQHVYDLPIGYDTACFEDAQRALDIICNHASQWRTAHLSI
jgi:hypothetical protein